MFSLISSYRDNVALQGGLIDAYWVTGGPSGTATATYGLSQYSEYGVRSGYFNPPADFVNEWINPTNAPAYSDNYEVRISNVAGTGILVGPTANVWHQLGLVNREWSLSADMNQTYERTFTVELRRIGSTHILESAKVTLSATVEI